MLVQKAKFSIVVNRFYSSSYPIYASKEYCNQPDRTTFTKYSLIMGLLGYTMDYFQITINQRGNHPGWKEGTC